MIKIWDNTYSK